MTRLLSRLAKKYMRARHTRGFGVHSPFAYDTLLLLRINGKTGFYADEEIEKCARPDGGAQLARDAIRFHRLCAALTDGDVYVSPKAPRAVSEAVGLASSQLNAIATRRLAPTCCVGFFIRETDAPHEVAEALAADCRTAWLSGYSDEEVRRIASDGGATLTLLGNRNSILFRRPQMQPVEYTVYL